MSKPVPWIAMGALHRDLRDAMQSEFAGKQLTVCILQGIPNRETAFAVCGDSKILLENLALDHEWLNVQPAQFTWSAYYFPGTNWEELVQLLAKEKVTLVILRPFG
jgi:hypothetical protein